MNICPLVMMKLHWTNVGNNCVPVPDHLYTFVNINMINIWIQFNLYYEDAHVSLFRIVYLHVKKSFSSRYIAILERCSEEGSQWFRLIVADVVTYDNRVVL